jgi:NAD(P)-dependent dehydrogenase (short-subunit alcohol dehydrogenase family)
LRYLDPYPNESEEDMTDKVWFVTGASRGLGRSVIGQALGAGHNVLGTARRIDALSEQPITLGRASPRMFTDPGNGGGHVEQIVDVDVASDQSRGGGSLPDDLRTAS